MAEKSTATDREVGRELELLMVDQDSNRVSWGTGRVPMVTAYGALIHVLTTSKNNALPEQLKLATEYGKSCIVQPLAEGHTEERTFAYLVSVRGRIVDRRKQFPVTLHAVNDKVEVEAGWKK